MILGTKNISSTLCQAPVRDHTDLVSTIGVVGCIIAFAAYLMRIASKAVGEGTFIRNLGWDDAVMTFAIAMMIPVSVLSPICKFNRTCGGQNIANTETVANLGLVSEFSRTVHPSLN